MVHAITLRRLTARLLVMLPFAAFLCDPSPGLAVPILPAELASFAVLGASGVTSANVSNIGGNLGSDPTAPNAAAGFNFLSGSWQPGTQNTAQTQLTSVRTAIGLGAGGATILNNTFTPGTYDFGAGLLGFAETLTLNGLGSSSAVWIFRFTDTLTTVQGSNFNLINVGDGSGVGLYWNVGISATLDGDTFAGNVLALTSITTNGDLTMSCGRLLADNGNVTLDGPASTISLGCAGFGANSAASGGFDQGVNIIGPGPDGGNDLAATPEPSTLLLFGSSLAGVGALWRRYRPS